MRHIRIITTNHINLVCDPDEQRAINIGRMLAHFAGMVEQSRLFTDQVMPHFK
jgi:hypothetical protein